MGFSVFVVRLSHGLFSVYSIRGSFIMSCGGVRVRNASSQELTATSSASNLTNLLRKPLDFREKTFCWLNYFANLNEYPALLCASSSLPIASYVHDFLKIYLLFCISVLFFHTVSFSTLTLFAFTLVFIEPNLFHVEAVNLDWIGSNPQ